ncbi:MAG: hypothetical protein Q7S28_02375 [bacterium]|nr:hypothetical protein [bacterium]
MRFRMAMFMMVFAALLFNPQNMRAHDVPRMVAPKEVEEVVPGQVYRFSLNRFHADDPAPSNLAGVPSGARQWNEEVFMRNFYKFFEEHRDLRAVELIPENNGDKGKMRYGNAKTTSYLVRTEAICHCKRLPQTLISFKASGFKESLRALYEENPRLTIVATAEERSGDYGAISGYYVLFEER